jgi:precorrin-6Y C5,15-methyltransferase (decarboxylating)
MKTHISVVGVGLSAEDLSLRALQVIEEADVLAGGRRLLGYFPGHRAKKVVLDRNVEATLRRLQRESRGKHIVLLASGDPNFYGIAPLAASVFGAERMTIQPNITAFQGAFARAKERWDNALFISLHGRDIAGLQKIAHAEGPAVIYCDDRNTPAAAARWLMDAQPAAAAWQARVFENLGQDTERVFTGTLKSLARRSFGSLAMMIITAAKPPEKAARVSFPGIADEEFSHDRGMITRRDVRLLALARLGCAHSRVLWDIGAGSGSLAIEAGLLYPELTVFAVERDTRRFSQLQKNIKKFRLRNVTALCGSAPDALKKLPRPDSVFIGGSGGRLDAILQLVKNSMPAGGNLVINGVTMATVKGAVDLMKKWKWRYSVTSVQIGQMESVRQPEIFRAENPVFIIHGTNA